MFFLRRGRVRVFIYDDRGAVPSVSSLLLFLELILLCAAFSAHAGFLECILLALRLASDCWSSLLLLDLWR